MLQLTQKRKKTLGALIIAGLYVWVMGTAYSADQNIKEGFIRPSVSGNTVITQENNIFHDPVRSANPFSISAAHKEKKNIPSKTALPSIPAMTYPRPNIPIIAARPVQLPQEALQQSSGSPSAGHEQSHEQRYSDPIAFIQTGNETSSPSDGITYYGGEGSHFSPEHKSAKEER